MGNPGLHLPEGDVGFSPPRHMPSSLQKLGPLCSSCARSCMHRGAGMSGGIIGGPKWKRRPSRDAESPFANRVSNDSACVQGRLSTACCPDLSTFLPNACPALRRKRKGRRDRTSQKARSAMRMRGRHDVYRRLASCWRTARFSSASSARVRKAERSAPTRLMNRAAMAGSCMTVGRYP
jgi:hypothetical protein